MKALKDKDEIINDLRLLRTSRNKQVFDKLGKLFVEKYIDKYPEFAIYFKNQWLVSNNTWYLGYTDNFPNTNNALESFNRLLKDQHTLRQKLPLNVFEKGLKEWLHDWTVDHLHGDKTFHTEPDIENDPSHDWRIVDKFVRSRKTIKQKRGISNHYLTVPGKDKIELPNFDRHQFTSLNEYKEKKDNYFHVTMPLDSSKYLKASCDCSFYYKKYFCCHTLGAAVRMGYVSIPKGACTIPIGMKKPRGRPKSVSKALQK